MHMKNSIFHPSNHIAAIITIKTTVLIIEYFCCNTTAVIPAIEIPTPNNKIGFPRAFAYRFLSSVLSCCGLFFSLCYHFNHPIKIRFYRLCLIEDVIFLICYSDNSNERINSLFLKECKESRKIPVNIDYGNKKISWITVHFWQEMC